MSGGDAELSELRAGVSCALLLERGGYSLDRADSTRRCLKYRRGAGEVLIVNHEGQGWWDPMSQAKGDVFTLAQRLDPGLNFGQVRKLLRGIVGMTPSYPTAERLRTREKPAVPPAERRAGRRRPCQGGDLGLPRVRRPGWRAHADYKPQVRPVAFRDACSFVRRHHLHCGPAGRLAGWGSSVQRRPQHAGRRHGRRPGGAGAERARHR